jgi:hypothetical protein
VQGAAKGMKKYSCPLCLALKGQPADLDAAINRTRRTRCVAVLLPVLLSCVPSCTSSLAFWAA